MKGAKAAPAGAFKQWDWLQVSSLFHLVQFLKKQYESITVMNKKKKAGKQKADCCLCEPWGLLKEQKSTSEHFLSLKGGLHGPANVVGAAVLTKST